jgi:serine/threonine protein kinase
MNEVRILSSLEHKNIIKVSSCILDNTEDVIYIFMEHAESGDLALLIEQAKEKKKRIP